jgi:hypothetical protein
MGPPADTTMLETSSETPSSDKGKSVAAEPTPPRSPMQIEVGSSSSKISPAVQLALDHMKAEIKEEMRNEFDELKADLRIDLRANLRADMNASGAATNQRIDELMAFMKKIAKQLTLLRL